MTPMDSSIGTWGVWSMEVVEVDVVTAEACEGSDDGREAILWLPVLSGGEG